MTLPAYHPQYWIFGSMNSSVLYHLDALLTILPIDEYPEFHLRLSTGQPKLAFNALLDYAIQTPYSALITSAAWESLRLAVDAYHAFCRDTELLGKLDALVLNLKG